MWSLGKLTQVKTPLDRKVMYYMKVTRELMQEQISFLWLGTVGCVCRDENGDFKGACYTRLSYTTTVVVAEAMVIRDGLEFAVNNHWQKVEIESDSKQVIQVLNGQQQALADVEVVMNDILYLGNIMEANFHFVKRTLNNVAHSIAHWGNGDSRGATWLHNPPHWLYMALLHDWT
ncbi:hypothetical protein LIER_02627 [Lithospermum erythrorhizon]|uniref:RNase H type-1 domain-containing protein n=1 Tax=Lithospermum erythrorhizon TaxID=34254 RepID=A0AAV3NQ63_LITER